MRSRPLHKGEPRLGNLVAYKMGMLSMMLIDDSDSPSKAQEVNRACTVLEVPRTELYGIRLYRTQRATNYEFAETGSTMRAAEAGDKERHQAREFKDKAGRVFQRRRAAGGVPEDHARTKNHPRGSNPRSGKDIQEKFDFLASKLGKEIKVRKIFKSGEEIDLMAVTTGKGWQGPIKRHGVSRLFHKATQKIRHVGAHGAFGPGKMFYTIPQAGGMGYNTGRSTTSAYSSWGPRKPPAR